MGAFSTKTYRARFQLADPFTGFCLRFLRNKAFDSWTAHINTPSYVSWRGNAFELVCWAHVPQIKAALGISGVETRVSSWQSKESHPGAQVDLVIDRRDGIVDLCEMKFTDAPFSIDQAYCANLANKREVFRAETGTRKALHTVMVCANGLANNAYAHEAQRVITADDLFQKA